MGYRADIKAKDNLRYSVNVCLFEYPNVTNPSISSPCDINYACEPLKTSLRAGNLDPNNGTQLDYCDADGGKFQTPKVSSCLQCLQASEDQEYTANCESSWRRDRGSYGQTAYQQ